MCSGLDGGESWSLGLQWRRSRQLWSLHSCGFPPICFSHTARRIKNLLKISQITSHLESSYYCYMTVFAFALRLKFWSPPWPKTLCLLWPWPNSSLPRVPLPALLWPHWSSHSLAQPLRVSSQIRSVHPHPVLCTVHSSSSFRGQQVLS